MIRRECTFDQCERVVTDLNGRKVHAGLDGLDDGRDRGQGGRTGRSVSHGEEEAAKVNEVPVDGHARITAMVRGTTTRPTQVPSSNHVSTRATSHRRERVDWCG